MGDNNKNLLINAAKYAQLNANASIGTPDAIVETSLQAVNNFLVFPPSPTSTSPVNCLIVTNVLSNPINSLTISNSGNSKLVWFFGSASESGGNYNQFSNSFDYTNMNSNFNDPLSFVQIWKMNSRNILVCNLLGWDPTGQRNGFKITFDPPLANQESVVFDYRNLQMIKKQSDGSCEWSNYMYTTTGITPHICKTDCTICATDSSSCCNDLPGFPTVVNTCYTDNPATDSINTFLSDDAKCIGPTVVDTFLKNSPYNVNVNISIDNIEVGKGGNPNNGGGDNDDSNNPTNTGINWARVKLTLKKYLPFIILAIVLIIASYFIYKIYKKRKENNSMVEAPVVEAPLAEAPLAEAPVVEANPLKFFFY